MNELMMYKQLKRIMRYGIPKHTAKEIVFEVAAILGNVNEDVFAKSLDYAMDLTYGLGLSLNQNRGDLG